jgi:VpsR domain
VLFITSDVSQFEHINLELKVSGWHCIHALDAAQGRHLLLDQKIDVDVVVVDSRSAANVVCSIAQDPALVEENVQWILIMDDEQSFFESFSPYAIVSPNITQRRLVSKIERALKETARQRQQARRNFSHQNRVSSESKPLIKTTR